ncbi:PREDICTED: histone-lysine N-methyltransferase SETMAR-like [Vollenhovia emeryi]|uniref:histone-lysine N-methyltransferase SETMAR-like n=1 Tax=Vollenhovia emeryi TaxID=411798 RepID=UPI0005F4E223|nr:PREDICTED: histone-lysine N-methyltransferase SETMAR-like [Vollenhovia emeryi]
MEVAWREIGTVWRMCKGFPAKLLQRSRNNPGNMWAGIVMQQNDAVRQHSWAFGLDGALQFRWEALTHPPYSPDLSPCDFHIFGALKKDIRGRRFASDAEVHAWIQS